MPSDALGCGQNAPRQQWRALDATSLTPMGAVAEAVCFSVGPFSRSRVLGKKSTKPWQLPYTFFGAHRGRINGRVSMLGVTHYPVLNCRSF